MRHPAGFCLYLLLVAPAIFFPGCLLAEDVTAPAPVTADDQVALVIGQSDYSAFPLASATADAALIAESLQQSGFDTESGLDLPEVAIDEKIKSFIEKVNLHGPNSIGLVYIAGRFAQINGENLLLPVGTPINRASEAAVAGFNIRKLLDALASVPMHGCVVMIDASAPPESLAGERTFALGLAIVDPPKGFLLAYSQNQAWR